MLDSKKKIAVLGQGYVGLPLAVEFGKRVQTIGFDIKNSRIDELRAGSDHTREVSSDELADAINLTFTSEKSMLKGVDFYIVTVPTPINSDNQPDLSPLVKVSEMLGDVISPGAIVIYESTVYPGATEEVCIPIIERISGLTFNKDFFAGYSPERINPGDKDKRLPDIIKVTSGSTEEVAEIVDQLYKSIIVAGTHKASSIKVAEAAKVIENTQRDLNIAAVNEFAKIFNKLGIDTEEVLLAAGTKWNFLPFRPGLVGGHCISVDPYYLTFKAEQIGYKPEVILAGRRINDGMPQYVATRMAKALSVKQIPLHEAKVLVLGVTFKANCPDIRNSKVIDVIQELESFAISVDVSDPWADPNEVDQVVGIKLKTSISNNTYDGIVIAVDHDAYKELGAEAIRRYGKVDSVIYDLKYVLNLNESDLRL